MPDELQDKLIPPYKAKHLKKINSMRETASAPDIHVPVVLSKGQVLFVTGESRNHQPSSCYNCWKYNKPTQTCLIHSANLKIRKFTDGDTGQGQKRIEYWPVCGLHEPGALNMSPTPKYHQPPADPDYTGLIWINAPKVGLRHGGANCGGANGGDDCDNFIPDEAIEDKREAKWGFCRVLQSIVAPGDCCSAWHDDDEVRWQQAQDRIREQGQ